MKIVAIIQARMGSTRLPGKVLKDICGRPMLWHIHNRLRYAKLVGQAVIATSNKTSDCPITKFAEQSNIPYYAGSELDLLDRWYQTAKRFQADAVVRITADCPLVDPVIVDEVVKYYLEKGPLDYVSNSRPKATYPQGLDVEIYSCEALKEVWNEIQDPFLREWGSANFFEHPERYRLANLENSEDLSHMRWTVDYQDDLDFVREIYQRLYREDSVFLMPDILKLLKEHPELMKINRSHVGKDTYKEALSRRD
ncbi:MAG: acylneuraminate cytidylyltransferase [Chloroflexi bacterium]|nr:acylneuraminate cytidylyltransferase [Chloroflexota bacterium]